ncbi:MAG: hemerythrin domain-containing protein [Candidatus Electrothrix sp. AR4]|nr:hemerythrin domain-containing protein [Candidatus Electrothrix sp. AR4]
MDKLTRAYLDHGKISEEMTFFEKFLEVFEAGEVQSYIERLRNFSDEYIVEHFKFEEEEIFPLIFQHGNAKEKRMAQELQEEHAEILGQLIKFKGIVFSYGSQPNEKQVEEIMLSSRMVVKMILAHARKEDVLLFPNL